MRAHDQLQGEVWTHGTLAYVGLAPRLTAQGLIVNRLRIDDTSHNILESTGPHFLFYPVVPFLLTNIETSDLLTGAVFLFSGPCLGHVSLYEGYSALDGGRFTRSIVKLELRVQLTRQAFQISVQGESGPLLPWSVPAMPPSQQERETFQVWFSMRSEEIPRVVDLGGCAKALQQRFADA